MTGRTPTTAAAACASMILLPLLLTGLVPAAHGQQVKVEALKAADLPRRPDISCNTPGVLTAITKCAFTNATDPSCCKGLDAVFADKAVSSYGCLCYPPVLYQVVTKASQSGVDVLGTLQKCRQRFKGNFTTQWASALPTACPPMAMDVNAVTLAPHFAGAAIFNKTINPHWGWENLLQMGEAVSWTPYVHTLVEDIFGIKLVQILLGVFVALPLIFAATNAALLKFSVTYRALLQHQRLVTVQHTVYAVVFGLSLVPQTYLTLQCLFYTLTGEMIATKRFTYLLGLFVVPRIALYVLEASNRMTIKPNTLLVFQRVMTVLTGFIVVLSRNPALLGMAVLMDLSAVHEAPLYFVLVSRRLKFSATLTRVTLRAGCSWFVITRLFQLVVLMYMVVVLSSVSAVNRLPEFIILSALYLAYIVGQLVFTLVLYHRMDLKLNRDSTADMLPVKRAGRSSASLDGFVDIAPVTLSMDGQLKNQPAVDADDASSVAMALGGPTSRDNGSPSS